MGGDLSVDITITKNDPREIDTYLIALLAVAQKRIDRYWNALDFQLQIQATASNREKNP